MRRFTNKGSFAGSCAHPDWEGDNKIICGRCPINETSCEICPYCIPNEIFVGDNFLSPTMVINGMTYYSEEITDLSLVILPQESHESKISKIMAAFGVYCYGDPGSGTITITFLPKEMKFISEENDLHDVFKKFVTWAYEELGILQIKQMSIGEILYPPTLLKIKNKVLTKIELYNQTHPYTVKEKLSLMLRGFH